MVKRIKITDAIQGHISLAKSKRGYFKTKDSASKSGHSLIAQIDMTHSGIVTRNYGFYLPAKMKAGAASFTKNYAKPLLVGHDEDGDSKPVGRVINAEYVDTSESYVSNDRYLQSLFGFQDAKKDKSGMLDFVNHVINEYESRDGYKGLGTIRGTLKVEDEAAIGAILDERYLTVSTSMMSDSATCNICGTDWVTDGLCDHSRGQTYDDNVCVVIPGMMSYDHLGIVNTPADPHAHDFKILGENPAENKVIHLANSKDRELFKGHNDFAVAANLFACNDSTLVPLSEEKNIDLIEVKDNIQKMENAMKKNKNTESIEKRIKDALDVKIEVYRYGEKTQGSKEVTVHEYMETLNEEALQAMIAQIAGMVKAKDSANVKDEEINNAANQYLDENFTLVEDATKAAPDTDVKTEKSKKAKKSKKKAKKMDDKFKLVDAEEISEEKIQEIKDSLVFSDDMTEIEQEVIQAISELIASEDAITLLSYSKEDSAEKILETYRSLADSQKLKELDAQAVYEMMKEEMDESKRLEEDAYAELKSSDFCGMRGYFPVIDKDHYQAAKSVLGKIEASDSVKGRILSAIEKKAKKIGLDLTDSFDNDKDSCNNIDIISIEEAIKAYEDAKKVLVEREIEIPDLVQADSTEKDQEIEILESQLEAANEELDSLALENDDLKEKLGEQLAVRTVDMKILSKNFQIEDRVKEIADHKTRSLDSLEDTLKDLEDQVDVQNLIETDGLAGPADGEVKDPTLTNNDSTASNSKENKLEEEEENRFKLYDQYNKRAIRYGRNEADRWLKKVQNKNGSIPTID